MIEITIVMVGEDDDNGNESDRPNTEISEEMKGRKKQG